MKARAFLAILVCALTTTSVYAAEAQDIEATGEASIYDNDKAQARDKAIDDALRKAVESAVGTMVSSETITENYQLISDKIYSKAEGYVKKYKILEEKASEGVFIVKVQASVATGAVSADLDGIKNLLKRKGMPKVLIMVAEQNVGMNGPSGWWARGPGVSTDMQIVENTLMELMRDKGFTFVDHEVLSGKKKIEGPISSLSDKQAREIASVTDAEIILVGKAMAKEIGQTMEGSRLRSADAEVAIRAINTDNGEIIAVASDSATVPHLSPATAGSQALKKASQKVCTKLIDGIAKKWTEDTTGANRILMKVTGVKNNSLLNKFINAMRNQIRGVKEVNQQKLKQGTAVLDVMLAGDTKSMAAEMEAKDYGGAFKIEVEEVSPNSMTVKLIQ